jgi:hypothetical protein
MLGWIRHEPALGFLEMTRECEDAEDMIDYIQTGGKERRIQSRKEGEVMATGLGQVNPFIRMR